MKKLLISGMMMLGVLILAALFDQLYIQAAKEAGQTFNFTSLTWLKPIFTLTLAAAVLGLVWFSLYYSKRSIVVSLIFSTVGLFILASLTIQVSMFWSSV